MLASQYTIAAESHCPRKGAIGGSENRLISRSLRTTSRRACDSTQAVAAGKLRCRDSNEFNP